MNSGDLISIILSLVSGVIGGVVVAIVNHLLTKRKTEAEIKKLEAETTKILAETKQMVGAVSYELATTGERVIYDSAKGYAQNDFQGKEGRFYVDNKRSGPKGLGTLTVEEGGVLNIQRTNTGGRFEVRLQRYLYDNLEQKRIPRNALIAAQRKLRISCQAKVLGGEHSLRFVLKNDETGAWLANEKVRVTRNDWTPITLYFQVSPDVDLWVRIDDEQVAQAPSSVQIRNLVVAERT
jgi:hypothetical protein